MECIWCESFQHRECTKISADVCNALSSVIDNIVFLICSSCLQLLPVALKYYSTQSNIDSNVAGIERSLLEIQKSEKNLCDLVKQFETQLHNHHKSVGSILTDHVSGVDTKVKKCCGTLASNSSSASSSVVVNVVQELKDKERRKENVWFFNISESDASNLEAGRNYDSKLCKDTIDLDVKKFESISSWQESAKQTHAGHC